MKSNLFASFLEEQVREMGKESALKRYEIMSNALNVLICDEPEEVKKSVLSDILNVVDKIKESL